jgi:hypothetical protein
MRRRDFLAGVGVAGILAASGCSGLNPRNGGGGGGVRTLDQRPTAPQLVAYVNDNARLIPGIEARDVAMDCRQDRDTVVVFGRVDCQKPRNFRLTAKVAGMDGVDLGSNNKEFWYWISKAPQPYVFHCDHADFAQGKVALQFPFQPDMILTAMGMTELDPNKQYEVRVNQKTVELIEPWTSPQGQPGRKVVVFNRGPVSQDAPLVMAHVLQDNQGREICTATITQTQRDQATGAVLPRRVHFRWPSEKIELKLKLDDARVANPDQQLAARLFSRANLVHLESFDLSRRVVDTPGRDRLQRTRGSSE